VNELATLRVAGSDQLGVRARCVGLLDFICPVGVSKEYLGIAQKTYISVLPAASPPARYPSTVAP
jgi:hypothetical protein